MEIYAKACDVKVWRAIKKGNYLLPAAAQSLTDPEDIDSYTNEQMAVVQVNNKARNLLYNAISGEEYEKISSCDTTKEIWDKLEVTYEGTNKVKETHINILVHNYKLFSMKEGESIEEMFARFSKIISDLKAFGKPYTSGDQVKKILRSLPTTWQTKVVTLESQDLNNPPRRDCYAVKKHRWFNEKIQEYEERKNSPRRSRQYNELDKNDEKCYEYGRFGHIHAECPDLKTKNFRGFNKNKSFGSWSDEDSSEHEEIANLCFMTILENKMNKSSGYWTDEDTSNDECKDDNENCFMARGETSEDILDLTLKESQKMMNELKRLNKDVKDWKLKYEACEIEKEVLQKEFEELQMQLNGMRKYTNHSSVRSNQATYKSTGKGLARTESTSTKTNKGPKRGQELRVTTITKVDINIFFVAFVKQMFQDGFENQKPILNLVILTLQDPSKIGYLKESNRYVL
ncbi:uncharacterized protein [Nicotiana sylvestris]|uniref:uncharacterized protein n=1 Tax=Nicotiana sylvestris TaxID=4096 RepID=UPI00388C8D43